MNATKFPSGLNETCAYRYAYSRQHYLVQKDSDPEYRRQLDAMRASHLREHSTNYVTLYIRSSHNFKLIDKCTARLDDGTKHANEEAQAYIAKKYPKMYANGNYIICHE